jgi:uncharacterized membrane protein
MLNRNLVVALALLIVAGCSSETLAPTTAKLPLAPSLDVLSIGSGPTYLSRGTFTSGVLEDINNAGTQVGTLRAGSVSQAVKYVAGHPVSLTPPSGTQSQAFGINESDDVVGSYSVSGTTFPVYWTPAGVAVPLTGSGGVLTGAYDINENGLIVGFIFNGSGTDRAGYWNTSGGGFIALALPPGAIGSQAHAVNDNGDIVGQSYFSATDFRPTLWKAPLYQPQVLALPGGFPWGLLRGINNSGMIVGSVAASCGSGCTTLRPAFWLNESSAASIIGGAVEFIARDINENGIVVGGSGTVFAWSQPTGMVTLPNRFGAGLAINDGGDVVGYDQPSTVQEPTQWSLVYQRDDADGDGVADVDDNCPRDANVDQSDLDGDGLGDACDHFPHDPLNDADGDGVSGEVDNCSARFNPHQEDADGDGMGDVCDPFPRDADNDVDRDGIGGDVDNCPRDYNPRQEDSDRDGLGDACDRNTPPSIVRITLPAAPIAVGTPAIITVDFTDPDAGDRHTAQVDWEVATTVPTVAAGARSYSASNSFSQAGVYTVVAYISDNNGGADKRSSALELIAYIVVFDPGAGFVTGGGSIASPEDACTLATCTRSTTGKASFGFVSKYQRGAAVPTGNTEFHFKAGDLRFSSSSYDWLVVAGSKALYKGEGTINGGGRYGFMITAIDGKDDGSPDRFRIKIWDFATGVVVYDNKRGSADDSGDATAIESGSIVIHR